MTGTMERVVGRLLQVGVLMAAAVVATGGVMLLGRHGGETANYAVFASQPDALRSVGGIVRGALAADARAIVQLGLLLLIATPVARVVFTLLAFIVQRDRLYVAITSIVLAVLAVGLFWSP